MKSKAGAMALLMSLVVLTMGAVLWSNRDKQGEVQATIAQQSQQAASQMVTCLIGSEKADYFNDPRVVKILADNGLTVVAQKEGSREMAFRKDLQSYDCAFPAGEPSAMAIKASRKVKDVYPVFFTPVVVASWTDLLKPLEAAGVVSKKGPTYYISDMGKLFDMVQQNKRWKDLPDNDKFAVSRAIFLSSTDPAKSNSGQMYMALASYVGNGDKVVSSADQLDHVMPLLTKLVLEQGYMENSSAGPFDDYVTMGMGKAPLVVSYESLFIAAALRNPSFTQNRVLLYPTPTIFTKHVLVPLSARGDALGKLLSSDPQLRQIAIEYGFRTNDTELFDKTVVSKMPFVPKEILDVAETPTFDVLEAILTRIAAARQ
ncbi:hypothetical protein F6X40_09925 [Paraburkholderia sp. UCT31]|uniref:hypothetical protein n=1 Tax=Paraburkholderia sp. UCT31 TaxID=2615209 RepID=UPI0016551F15|nr:hypothetical protein [Paraburkholderia sp. UCT31]MBC8737125.1 hypothetical protein [Paraburkholderia sp. UCT31]